MTTTAKNLTKFFKINIIDFIDFLHNLWNTFHHHLRSEIVENNFSIYIFSSSLDVDNTKSIIKQTQNFFMIF